MIKGTPELIAGRREEIINACEKLYESMSFREITLKELGNAVPFSRPTIYNYFQTKEEIFLALFAREYDRWNADLESILERNGTLTAEQLAQELAATVSRRGQMLKLLAMNNYDMEANSRQEMLTEFKRSYGNSMKLVERILEKYCPDMSKEEIGQFIYMFFPFMFGIYPYSSVTEKQRTAMEEAGTGFVEHTAYELTYRFLIRILKNN